MARPDYLNVYLLTFNCGRALVNPTAFAPHLFTALQQRQTDSSVSNSNTTSIADRSSTASTDSSLPDVLVLNLQEVAPIAYAFLGGSFLAPYFERFTTLVELAAASKQNASIEDRTRVSDDGDRPKYVNIITRNIGLTAIMIFVRTTLVSRLDGIMSAEVGVGVHETGNKGAVGVRLGWRLDTSASYAEDSRHEDTEDILHLTFVSAHLAPMEEALQRRNQDYKEIVKGLVFTSDTKSYFSQSASSTGDGTTESEPLLSESATDTSLSTGSKQLQGMYTGPTHLFFAGDLNYRTSIHPPSTAEIPSFPRLDVDPTHEKHFSRLLQRDQLSIARRNGETLHGLSEQEIHFPPTYKYDIPTGGDDAACHVIDEADTKRWEWASHRWPSWCDRILFFQPSSRSKSKSKSEPDNAQLIPQTYTALPLLTTSDHRPVALSVLVPLIPISSESSSELSKAAPVPLDPNWKSRRATARRREIVVGISSYFALTREGNAFVIGGVAAILGGLLIARSW